MSEKTKNILTVLLLLALSALVVYGLATTPIDNSSLSVPYNWPGW